MAHDFQLQAKELMPYQARFILSPEKWGQYQPLTDLSWDIVRFGEAQVNQVPREKKGVYTFVLQPGIANHSNCSYLLYVGMTEKQDFRKRFSQYLREKEKARRPYITDMLTKWDGYLWFCYAEIDDEEIIKTTEDSLLRAYIPPFNREFPGDVREAIKVLP